DAVATGFGASGINLGAAVVRSGSDVWFAAKASIASAALQNIPNVSATATSLSLAINTASSGKVVNFAAPGQGLVAGPVTLDFAGAAGSQLSASGTLSLSASSFVQAKGTLSVTRSTIDANSAVAGLTSASLLTISVAGTDLFAGLG